MAIQGIPTLYASTQFRSRLEARWAAFLDLVGWSWEYEPLELPGWVPDFRLAPDLLAEVTPSAHAREHRAKVARSGHRGVVALLTDDRWSLGAGGDALVVGSLRPRRGARWAPLTLRGTVHSVHPFCLAPDARGAACLGCGHPSTGLWPGARAELHRKWRLAGNATQWRGAARV